MNQKKSILIVEDNLDFAESLRLLFSIQERATEIVHSGAEALEIFDPALHAIILMDIRIPGISGIDTLLQIRKQHPDFPVLLMTANNQNSPDVAQARKAGPTALIFKPFNFAILLNQIESILQSTRQED
jgi:DNA-binding response OmpR family regulator